MSANDQQHYETVAAEIQQKVLRPGLWTRAFAESGGEDAKAKALYIRLRVAELKEEEKALVRQEAERRRKEADIEREESQPANKDRSIHRTRVMLGFFFALLFYGGLLGFTNALSILGVVCWLFAIPVGYVIARRKDDL